MRSNVVDNTQHVYVTIDGQAGKFAPSTSVLEAATLLGIEIPTLCHHPDLSPVGSCRLCLVEIDGRTGQHPACVEPVCEGLNVTTESQTLTGSRRFVLEMLLSRYINPQSDENRAEDTEFLRWVQHYNVQQTNDEDLKPRYPVDSDPNPFIRVDLNQCILCTLCVRACEEEIGRAHV